jgi:hypothetical protein
MNSVNDTWNAPCGFPHSEICGSRLICSSPQLIAACHVLLRLLLPRHSPCALFYLTLRLSRIYWAFIRSFNCIFLNPNIDKYLFPLICLLLFALLVSVTPVKSHILCFYFALSIQFSRYIRLKFSGAKFKSWTFAKRMSLNFYSMLKPSSKLVGSSGLEPPTSRLSGARSNRLSYEPIWRGLLPLVLPRILRSGGDEQIRTVDPLLARQVLSHLSYTPIFKGSFRSHCLPRKACAFQIE